MEKEITITEIKAKFVKDFETFSKMDPFLVFTIGKSEGKTETAENAGKEPVWKSSVTLTYYDEEFIKIVAYEEDLTSNELMGQGKIDVKSLKPSGTLDVKIEGESEHIGDVSLKYVVKTLPPAPLLIIKNIKCDFYKQTKFMIKTKPYFGIEHSGKNTVTSVLEDSNGKQLSWKDQNLRVKIKEADKLNFIVFDKEDNESKIFSYSATPKQFRTLSGTKSFNVIDSTFEPLGVINFDYQTQNFVNKEESIKNEQNYAKESNQLTLITIEKIKGSLTSGNEDIYLKINLGPNMFKTNVIENAKKDFTLELNQPFYAEKKENKMIFAAFDKDIISDDNLGNGELPLEGLSSGNRIVALKNKDGKHFGDITLSILVQKVPCKSLTISDIKATINKSTDLIGSSEPYVIARIGGWSGRTQTQDGQKVQFKKSIDLRFSMQKQLTLEVWDEDLNEHEKLFNYIFDVSSFKAEGDQKIPFMNQKKEKVGEIYFKYKTKNVVQAPKKEDPPKKSQKKFEKKKQTPVPTPRDQLTQQAEDKLEKSQDESSIKKAQHSQQQSINRSRDTFKLPAISESRNYGDKIYNKQSAATLQRSVHAYSMPRANRFGQGPKYQGEPSYYMDSSFKPNSGKGTGFGYGNKKQFPDWMVKNMKEVPAPSAYFDNQHSTSPEFRPKGPTFGIGHKYYEKVTIPKQKYISIPRERLRPLK